MGYTAISPFVSFNYEPEPVNKKALPVFRKGF